jgi:hypothetical protein
MFGPTPQKIEGLCYVMPVTGHKAYSGKEEEEEEKTPFFLSYTYLLSSSLPYSSQSLLFQCFHNLHYN